MRPQGRVFAFQRGGDGAQVFLDARGVVLRVAYLPYPLQVSDFYRAFPTHHTGEAVPSLLGPQYQLHASLVAREAALLGIPFLDLTPVLRAESARGKPLYWSYDEHMRPEGYAFVAGALEAWAEKPYHRRR